MKVLIVCSKNSGRIAPFITDQVESLLKLGVVCEYFTIEGKGVGGYLQHRGPLLRKISDFAPDVIHAHYGLSGLLANTQRKVAVVTTYHGSDINEAKVFPFSWVSIRLSRFNIFVSQKNMEKAKALEAANAALIPCGVDTDLFQPMDRAEARKQMGLDPASKYVLFAGAFDNRVKNPGLAKEAIEQLRTVRLLELKAYTRREVALLMNAVDACLMTSFSEGSPQFIKEALACNCAVVSVDVGDVKAVIEGVEGCYIANRDAKQIAVCLEKALSAPKNNDGYERIRDLRLNANEVANKLLNVYQKIIDHA